MGNQVSTPTSQDKRARKEAWLVNSIGLTLATIVRVGKRLQELEQLGLGTEREQWKLLDISRGLPVSPGSSERNQSLVEFNQTTLAELDSYIKQNTAELECLRGKER